MLPVLLFFFSKTTVRKSNKSILLTPFFVKLPRTQKFKKKFFTELKLKVSQPFPSPGDLPNPGIKPGSLALQADSFTD